MEKQKVTIKEIARLAQTSRGTVDRVINNRGKVKKDVEARIRKVIHDTGYEKSFIAKRLASKRNIYIGVIIGTINNDFFNLVLHGIKNGILKYEDYGLTFIIKEVELLNFETIYKAVDELKSENLDFLIVTAPNNPKVCEKINELECPKIAVNIDLDVNNKVCFIGCDYFNCGALAANIYNVLFRNEEKEIAVILGSLEHSGQIERLRGLRTVLNKNIKVTTIKENFDNDQISYDITKQLINTKKVDAVCYLGAGINGGLKALKETKHKDLNVITVDQSKEVVDGLKSGLVIATITQHAFSQGLKSVENAFNYLIKESNVKDKIYENNIYLKESIIPQHN